MFWRKNKNAMPTVTIETDPKPLIVHRSWLHRLLRDTHGARYFVIALLIALASGAGLYYYITRYAEHTTPLADIIPHPKPPKKFYSPLTGVETDEATTKRPVTAIMIENSPEARPQSGLKDAGIVYEAIAEGGITRFVALYQESRPSLIGPVRSVRPYYVEWASAYDPAVAHVGGSVNGLSMIRSGNYGVDMDQFFNASTYWRSTDRYAPHNVYTSFDKLDELRTSKGKTASNFKGFTRQDGKASMTPNAKSVAIDVSSGQFHVEYTYDAGSNTYLRSQGGVAHVDREGGRIAPAVVVAIKVTMSIAMEDGYREQITTTGSGQAYVFQNGFVTECTWSRVDAKSPLELKTPDGKPVALNRGQTWITALDTSKGVSWQ